MIDKVPANSGLLFRIGTYLQYQWKASGPDSIHSPFVFSFYSEVLNYPYQFSIFEKLEMARQDFLLDQSKVRFEDAGAGKGWVDKRISEIASGSLMPFSKASLLFKLCRWLKPESVLELGTCLGLTTAYLASATNSEVHTFEAALPLAERARKLWEVLGLDKIQLVEGKIENTLPNYLAQVNSPPDFVLIDANHRYAPTMENFYLLRDSMKEQGCLVFDDIYWSSEMAKAWKEIISDPAVTVSLDLYGFGIVFFRPMSSKENFVLRW
jgi:predicted O-methyltransferase YrrM